MLPQANIVLQTDNIGFGSFIVHMAAKELRLFHIRVDRYILQNLLSARKRGKHLGPLTWVAALGTLPVGHHKCVAPDVP